MASLLVFVGLLRLPGIMRRGMTSSFLVGFEAFGWAAVFLFIACSTLSPPLIGSYGEAMASVIRPIVGPLATGWPEWALAVLEFGVVSLIFGLPEFLVAVAGGWLARKAGLSLSRRQAA
jgi:hypothetical protein